MLAPHGVPRDAATGAAVARSRDGRARPSHLPRSERPPRPRALHPLRTPRDRQGVRRSGYGADRAGTGVPPGRLLRRGASHRPSGDPGGRGQELLHPLRRGLPGAAARRLQDGDELPGCVVAWRRTPPESCLGSRRACSEASPSSSWCSRYWASFSTWFPSGSGSPPRRRGRTSASSAWSGCASAGCHPARWSLPASAR
jgi:hypothetical protein